MFPPTIDTSRRDTTGLKVAYLGQLDLDVRVGTRNWVHRALAVRVAETDRERRLAAGIVRRRHYLAKWPVPKLTRFISYLGDLRGISGGDAGAAAMAMVALLPANYHVTAALGLAQYEVLTLVRSWRADDLGPLVTPDLAPEVLRRVVRGERGWTPDGDLLRPLEIEWAARKLDARLRASPRLLATYADPAVGHDGATYLAAGATFCGRAKCGKLLFAWALDPRLRQPLGELAAAVTERPFTPFT